MAKRKIEKDYHDLAKSRGFIWIGDMLPKNAQTKTAWKCSKGHIFESGYSNIQQGVGCSYCFGNAKKTKKDYHMLAKSRGFKWIDTVLPKNVCDKTLWLCLKNHKFKSTYNKIKFGRGCPYCSNRVKKTEKDYYNLAKFCKFRWLGKKLPKNTGIKTLWQCESGHTFESRYYSIKQGRRCPYCSRRAKKTKEDYYKLAKSCGFKWVSGALPKNVLTKTWWECEKGDRWEAKYADIYSRNGCPHCYGNIKKTEKDYHILTESCGFKWIGKVLPRNIQMKTLWQCKNNHKFESSYNNIHSKHGCPYCINIINGRKVSKPQIKLNDMLAGFLNYPENRYRIDVAIMRRSQKIAVEYDCQYWHEGNEKSDAKRDNFLISRGWKILHVKSNNLLPNRKQMKQAINELLKSRNTINLYLNDWV